MTETHRPPAERERTSGGTATRSRTARLGLFYRQVIAELRKVVWPTAQETRQVTLVVFVMIIVLSLFFWALDSLLGFLTRWLATGGG